MLVTIEGLDGSGKSTVTQTLASEYPEAVITKEPDDDTWMGEHVRDVIADDEAPPFSVLFAFLEDHAHHLNNTIEPALEAGNMVICDRYIDSRYAYQTAELEEFIDDPLTWLQMIQEKGWSQLPDLTLYINISPETALERVTGRGEATERFEKLDSLQRINEVYDELIQTYSDRYVIIDGVQSEDPEENKRLVAESCIEAIESRR